MRVATYFYNENYLASMAGCGHRPEEGYLLMPEPRPRNSDVHEQ